MMVLRGRGSLKSFLHQSHPTPWKLSLQPHPRKRIYEGFSPHEANTVSPNPDISKYFIQSSSRSLLYTHLFPQLHCQLLWTWQCAFIFYLLLSMAPCIVGTGAFIKCHFYENRHILYDIQPTIRNEDAPTFSKLFPLDLHSDYLCSEELYSR